MPRAMLVAVLLASVLTPLVLWPLMAHRGLTCALRRADGAWAQVDALLARRRAVAVGLAEAVRAVVPAERPLASAVLVASRFARVAENPDLRADSEHRLSAGLASMAHLVEHHPLLGSDPAFIEGQLQLADLDDELLAARRHYNVEVQRFLRRRSRLPASALLRLGLSDIPERAYFELHRLPGVDGAPERAVA